MTDTPFQGETMTCVMCRKQQQSNPARQSNWTRIDIEADKFYVCPTCLQDSPYVRKTGNFAGQYERVLRKIASIIKKGSNRQ